MLLLMSVNYLNLSWRWISQHVVHVVCSLYASSCFLSFIQDEEPRQKKIQITESLVKCFAPPQVIREYFNMCTTQTEIVRLKNVLIFEKCVSLKARMNQVTISH